MRERRKREAQGLTSKRRLGLVVRPRCGTYHSGMNPAFSNLFRKVLLERLELISTLSRREIPPNLDPSLLEGDVPVNATTLRHVDLRAPNGTHSLWLHTTTETGDVFIAEMV